MSDTTPVSVVSTIARKSLGVEFTTTFDRRVHLQVDKCWDADEGRWRAIGQMEWYLRKVSLSVEYHDLGRSAFQSA
jgi:hypothetical protein